MSSPGRDPVLGASCPKCKRETVIYDGNYFCESRGCNWVMPEPHKGGYGARDAKIVRAYLIQRRTLAVKADPSNEVARMDLYLAQLRRHSIRRRVLQAIHRAWLPAR